MTTSRKKLTQDEFISKAKQIHGDKYNYSESVYINTRTKVKIICADHGEFYQKPNHHLGGSKCPECIREQKSNSKDTFIEKARKVHGNRFVYSDVKYVNNKTKVKIICPINGEFWQLPNNHLAGHTPFDNKNTKTTEYFIKKSVGVHGDKYDYSETDYQHNNKKVKIKCPIHGIFEVLPHNHSKPMGSGCPKCNASQYEESIRGFLLSNNITFKEKDRDVLNGMELDFYIPDYNIAIEIDGMFWHCESNGRDKDYHLSKTERCKEIGINLFHFTDIEMKYNFQIIKSFLNKKLNLKRQVRGEYDIKLVDSDLKKLFHQKYNISGDINGGIDIGIFRNKQLVLCLNFQQLAVKNEWELSRISELHKFENKKGIQGVIKYFEDNYKPNRLIIKINRRFGDTHDIDGFKKISVSEPRCWIFRNGYIKTNKIYSENEFNNFEQEYIEKYNWERYWDCGVITYAKTYNNRHKNNLNELIGFLNDNDIEFKQIENTFAIRNNTIHIKYVDSENYKINQPEYGIEGVHRDYFINITKNNKQNGIRTIWIKDFEMEYNDADGYKRKWEVLKSYIKSSVGKVEQKYYARDCEIRELSNQDVRIFLEKNCFYGYRSSTVILGLFAKKDRGSVKSGDLLMVYTFGFPFFSKGKYDIEVIRVATKINHQILGGASKLLKFFILKYPTVTMAEKIVNVNKIIFIVDADHNDAHSLEKIGFNFVKHKGGGFMNVDATTGKAFQRKPMKHNDIKRRIERGEMYMVGNAGSMIYEINRYDLKGCGNYGW